jgi:hypothetical protein
MGKTQKAPVCGKDHTYQGYTNYETWAVALWVDNDEGLYRARRALLAGMSTVEDHEKANALKEWVEEMMPDVGATLWADLLGGALSEVNWIELARNWAEEE